MHDRFEKEVQKKMEELRLMPSAPVWQKIEIEITPEKKRRRIIIWLFLGLLLLSGGFLMYQFAPSDTSTASSLINTDAKKEATKTPKSVQQQNATTEKSSIDLPKDQITSTTTNGKQSTTVSKTNSHISRQSEERKNARKQDAEPTIVSINKPAKSNSSTTEDGLAVSKLSTPASEALPAKNNQSISRIEEVSKKDSSSVVSSPNTQDTSVTTLPAEKQIDKAIADSGLKKKVAINKGWKKRFTFSVGQSGYTTGLLSKSAVNDVLYQSPGPGVAGNVSRRPAKTNPGLGFSAGISFVKKLNEHFELALGAQYAYYSTQTIVGSQLRRDTLVVYNSASLNTSNFYTNTANEDYTNRFHVIEMPVTLSYRPSTHLPIYLSIGAAYGRIVSTNALTYSPNSNVYYENKENYLRNTLPVFSSVQVELFAKKKVSLRIGPALQYNLLKVQNETSSGQSHFFFAGIKGGVNF